MHSFTYRGFNTGPPLDRKPVWLLLTALAFAVIGMVMMYEITLPRLAAPLSLASDTSGPKWYAPSVLVS